MPAVDEVPEQSVRRAEAGVNDGGHGHDGVAGEDGTLASHLEEVHGLEVPRQMSPATQAGLHDRLHGDTAAADD